MIVGVTGGIGSGKSTVVNFFLELGNIAFYHADIEAKNIINSSVKVKTKIEAFFGKEAYKDNVLNRKYISNIVFHNPESLKQLNAIVHPEVKKHFKNFVNQHKNKEYILYENAILFETKSHHTCDFIISVYCDLKTRISRIKNRDNISENAILDRINNQWKEDKKLLQSNYLITNFAQIETKNQVNHIHNILTKKRKLI